jgi:hypothetical protein
LGTPNDRARARDLIGACLATAPAAKAFLLEGDRQVYDWDEGRFKWKRGLETIGPMPTEWLRE